MFSTHLMFQADKSQIEELTNEKHLCAFCGIKDYALQKKKVIKKTFTNRDLLKFSSDYICQSCAYALSKPQFRNNSLVVTSKKVCLLKQKELKPFFLNPPAPPFFICCAVSRKKWLHIRTKVNYSRERFYVQLEEQGVWVDKDRAEKVLSAFEQLLELGHGKGELLSGELYSLKLSKLENPYKSIEIYQQITPYIKSSFLQLVSFIAIAKEVKKNAGNKNTKKQGTGS